MMYEIDNACEKLVPKPVVMPAEPGEGATLNATVAQILKTQSPTDLSPMTYQIRVNQGEAQLDLKPAATATRSLESLSSCEQLALLGSLRETLVHHSSWGIRRVEFTARGKPLVL
jgi:hypothetical protein